MPAAPVWAAGDCPAETPSAAPAAAATDEAVPSRIFYEYLGLARGADGVPGTGDEEAGQGLLMRPTAETRIVNFSSRGPASDGRLKPEIAALGTWNFVQVCSAVESHLESATASLSRWRAASASACCLAAAAAFFMARICSPWPP